MDSKNSLVLTDDERIDNINDNLSLIQNKKFFKFGTDSLLLAGFIEKRTKEVALELGCGSGVISLLMLSRNRVKKMYAVEIQSYFCSLAERNFKLNGFEDKIKVFEGNVSTINGSMLGGSVDIVVSNPPYMKMTSGKHNSLPENLAARHELYADIDDFASCAAKFIKHGGDFYVVYRQDRLSDLMAALKNNRFEPKVMTFVHPDVMSPPSFVLVRSKYGASSGGLKITRPFFIYDQPLKIDSERKYSQDMEFLLEHGYIKN